jgi:peptide/nickel transport system substrate-binding protein
VAKLLVTVVLPFGLCPGALFARVFLEKVVVLLIRKGGLFILLFGLMVLLVGCQKNEYERRTDDANTLYVGAVAASFPQSFMPWLSRDGIAPTVASMLYNSLFSFDDETGTFEPLLAKAWYYVCEDGLPIVTDDDEIDYNRLEDVYGSNDKDYLPVKLILHEGMTWSDGTPITANDVYYTFDVAANNALSNHAGALAWTSDLQHRYSNGVLSKQGVFTYDHGALEQGYMIAEDERDTVVYLHVNKVLGAITTLFTSILILPEHIWQPIVTPENQLNSKNPTAETLKEYQDPVGSGPYTLDTEQSNAQVIVLKRRDAYHLDRDDGEPLYRVETIKIILYQEINVAIYALLKGHVDILDASISSNYLTLFDEEEDIFLSNAPGTFTTTLVLNLNPVDGECNEQRDLLSDVRFRKSIALAVDQTELIMSVLNGAGSTASSGLMDEKLTDFYNPEADTLSCDRVERLLEANQILDSIVPEKDTEGYRLVNGERISYEIFGHPGEQEVIAFLQIQLQKIGIEVDFKLKGSSPEKTYFYNSKFDMTIQGTVFSLSNVDIMYRAHFVTQGTSSNYGRLADDELTEAIEDMRLTLNLNRKYELIKEIQPMIASHYYKIPLYTSNVLSVARTDRYRGYSVEQGVTLFNTTTLQNISRVEVNS